MSDTLDTPGFYATVQTADGAPLRVSYGTGKTPSGQGHTGARVPVAAIGPQASNVMGVRDQTDLFYTLIGAGSPGATTLGRLDDDGGEGNRTPTSALQRPRAPITTTPPAPATG